MSININMKAVYKKKINFTLMSVGGIPLSSVVSYECGDIPLSIVEAYKCGDIPLPIVISYECGGYSALNCGSL